MSKPRKLFPRREKLSGKEILHVDPTQHMQIKTGDYLHVEFYPGTMRALRIEKGDAPEVENPEQDNQPIDSFITKPLSIEVN